MKTREFMALLDDFFDSMVEVPRLKHGDKQSITSLINEKVQLLAKYLRGEKANARAYMRYYACTHLCFNKKNKKRSFIYRISFEGVYYPGC